MEEGEKMRPIDADALIDETMERYCKDCKRRKGVKNGKWRIVYSIGDAPCRACGTGDMIDELENAPTIEERKTGTWTYTFKDGMTFILLHEGFSSADVWALEKHHGKLKEVRHGKD